MWESEQLGCAVLLWFIDSSAFLLGTRKINALPRCASGTNLWLCPFWTCCQALEPRRCRLKWAFTVCSYLSHAVAAVGLQAVLAGASPAGRVGTGQCQSQSGIPAGCDKYGPGKSEPPLPRVDVIYRGSHGQFTFSWGLFPCCQQLTAVTNPLRPAVLNWQGAF